MDNRQITSVAKAFRKPGTRDPNRIKPFLSKIEEAWQRYPDLRFGQLVEIIWAAQNRHALFYIEDKDFLNALDKRMKAKPLGDPNTVDLFTEGGENEQVE